MAIRVDRGLAYEALMAMSIVNGTMPASQFDNGVALKARFRTLPAALRRSMAAVDSGWGQCWADLVPLVSSASAPRGLPELRARIGRLTPMELKLTMLGYHDPDFRQGIGDELFVEAASGAPRAVARFRSRARRARAGLVAGPLVELPDQEVAERTLGVLAQLPREFYLADRGTQQVLSRSAAQAAGLARTLPADVVVTRLTRGIVAGSLHDVLLVPTAIHSPWTLILDHESTKVFCYPVAAAAAHKTQADPDLVELYRALGDATRLRMLRRLAAGRATFGQLSKDLGLARSTVHQHAIILRRAGLIRLHLDSAGLELNPDRPAMDAQLEAFLAVRPAHTGPPGDAPGAS